MRFFRRDRDRWATLALAQAKEVDVLYAKAERVKEIMEATVSHEDEHGRQIIYADELRAALAETDWHPTDRPASEG